MAMQILMPQLSPTMEEGRLAKWHVKEGDAVRSGDVVAEVETDKATMEVEAAEDGVIEKLLLAEGTEHVPVNHPIATLRVKDEVAPPAATKPEAKPQPKPEATASRPDRAPRAPSEATIASTPGSDPTPEAVLHRIAEQIRRNGRSRGGDGGVRIFASPLARRLAREFGLELGALAGSGPRGRIVKADVDRAARDAMRQAEPVAAARPGPEQPEQPRAAPRPQELVARRDGPEPPRMSDSQVLALYRPGSYEVIPHDTMRKIIADRLTLAKQTIPHFYLAIDCDLDALLAARARLNALAPREGPRAFT